MLCSHVDDAVFLSLVSTIQLRVDFKKGNMRERY